MIFFIEQYIMSESQLKTWHFHFKNYGFEGFFIRPYKLKYEIFKKVILIKIQKINLLLNSSRVV